MSKPRVLIGYSACPLTREAFERAGCEAWTCDLLPARGSHLNHIQGDIWDALRMGWDMAVLHPMCTYLTCSAAWAFNDPDYDRYPGVGYHQRVQEGTLVGEARRSARRHALINFQALLDLPFPVAIENPAPSFVSGAIRPPDQTIQPYEFGDDASKRTGLWLTKGLPKLIPTKRVRGRLVCCGRRLDNEDRYGCPNCNGEGRPVERWSNQTDSGQNRLSPGVDRWLERSKTYPGIAAAMGSQWGSFLVAQRRALAA